jgi:hypothetical protein
VPEKRHTAGTLCRRLYAVRALPCATHDKTYAVWILAFAVWLWLMAKEASPVVHGAAAASSIGGGVR